MQGAPTGAPTTNVPPIDTAERKDAEADRIGVSAGDASLDAPLLDAGSVLPPSDALPPPRDVVDAGPPPQGTGGGGNGQRVRLSAVDKLPDVELTPDGLSMSVLSLAREGVRSETAVQPGSGMFYFEGQRLVDAPWINFGVMTRSGPLDTGPLDASQGFGIDSGDGHFQSRHDVALRLRHRLPRRSPGGLPHRQPVGRYRHHRHTATLIENL